MARLRGCRERRRHGRRGLVVSDWSAGLAVDVRVRMLVVHQAEGFRERHACSLAEEGQTEPSESSDYSPKTCAAAIPAGVLRVSTTAARRAMAR